MQYFVYSPLHIRLRVTHVLSYGDKGHLYDCACSLAWVWGYIMCTRIRAHAYVHRLYSMKDKAKHSTAILVSSVQAVVACYVTAPRVCTLVLFI